MDDKYYKFNSKMWSDNVAALLDLKYKCIYVLYNIFDMKKKMSLTNYEYE